MRAPHLFLAAAVAGLLGTSSTPAWSLDLMQAYQAALAQDARIRAARAARDSAIERLPQAQAQLMPNIAINLGRNKNDIDRTQENALRQDIKFNEEYFSYNQTLQLRLPLFRMPLFAGLRQAGFVVDDAEATLERELQDLGSRVTGAYMEALLAQDGLDLVLKQKAVITTQLDAARKSLAAGFGTRTDIDEAQARLDMNIADELSARQHVEFTRRQLEILINQPVYGLATVDEKRLPLLPPEPADVAEWIRLAEASSPEVRALQARLNAAKAEISKARGGHYPTIDAVAQISKSGSENVTSPSSSYTNHLIGLQVNIPLFAGGYVNSTVRQAIAEQIRAEENLEATRRDLAVHVHREHRSVTEGVLKVRALEQAVRSAQQLVTSSKRSFEAGSRTMVDVLNAEQQLQTTLRNRAEARYLYLVTRVRLPASNERLLEVTSCCAERTACS
ncbi:MAG: TolC family outer membrane protein, partial [Ottowia sp.]|nr:TolC family outer membrane protein [Ottowia sp.]